MKQIEETETDIERAVASFFRSYALAILAKEGVDRSDRRAVKQALLEYYEQIYPAFAKTEVFGQCFEKPQHEAMVAAYKKNFYLLLDGKIPPSDEQAERGRLQQHCPPDTTNRI